MVEKQTFGDQMKRDFFLEIERGSVSGHANVHKFGENPSVSTSFETVWDEGGVYVEIPSATILKISSSDDTDDTAGQAGALTVEVFGLDANFDLQDETVALNGQTAVNTANTYIRIYRLIVRTAGANETASGDIYAGTGDLTDGVPATIYAKIGVGNNQTLMCVYTIPRNKKGYLLEWHAGAGANFITTVRFCTKPTGEVWQVKDEHALFRTFNSFLPPHPEFIGGKTDIRVDAKTSTSSGIVSAGFHLLIIDD